MQHLYRKGLLVEEPVPQSDLVSFETHWPVQECHFGPALVLCRHDVEVILVVSHLGRNIESIPLKYILLIDL